METTTTPNSPAGFTTMKAEDVFVNENGKRGFHDDEDQVMGGVPSDGTYSKIADFKRRKMEKRALKKDPVCTLEDPISPLQLLNEFSAKLEFQFDLEQTEGFKNKCVCKVKVPKVRPNKVGIDMKTETTEAIKTEPEIEPEMVEIVGDGLNKKDAKKKCAFLALMHLYPDSFKPPQEIIDTYIRDYTIQIKTPAEPKPAAVECKNNFTPAMDEKAKLLMNVQKKMKKLCTKSVLQTKTPSQLLHELCIPIAETVKEIVNESSESVMPDKKFKFEYRNALINPTSLAPAEFYLYIAQGHGQSKKDAKQNAAKQALKQFLDCDIDRILKTPDLIYPE